MLTFLCLYLLFSLLVGFVASVGFLYGYKLCRRRWWITLMLVCPLSWLAVAAFFIAYGFYCFFKMFTKNRCCVDCDYMRRGEYGHDAGLWRCTASCGNDDGDVCSAWFPRMPGHKSPDKDAKFYKVHKGGSPC